VKRVMCLRCGAHILGCQLCCGICGAVSPLGPDISRETLDLNDGALESLPIRGLYLRLVGAIGLLKAYLASL